MQKRRLRSNRSCRSMVGLSPVLTNVSFPCVDKYVFPMGYRRFNPTNLNQGFRSYPYFYIYWLVAYSSSQIYLSQKQEKVLLSFVVYVLLGFSFTMNLMLILICISRISGLHIEEKKYGNRTRTTCLGYCEEEQYFNLCFIKFLYVSLNGCMQCL